MDEQAHLTDRAGDVAQGETGADKNALRNNIPVGESRDYKVAAAHQIGANKFVIAAFVSDTDVDADECDVPEGYRPMKGDMARFTRTADSLGVTKL